MTTAQETSDAALRRTPLHDLHVGLGARMVPFAGYDMPVQYPKGIIAEHSWTREKAGLFDVSHMGQALLVGPDHATTAAALERLVPGDIVNLKPGVMRYSMLLNSEGGIIDDLMVTRPADPQEDGRLLLVVNASRKDVDYAYLKKNLPETVRLEPIEDRGLIALQGPSAAEVMTRRNPAAAEIGFMRAVTLELDGISCLVSRSGYTGEDGFEISMPADRAAELWSSLLEDAEVEAVGLGARDTLRLEAGLCLYGNDLDETTSPVEAGLTWAIQKRRRETGGFPGEARILRELAEGPARVRVGIRPEGRAPAREGAEIAVAGEITGVVTSGGFGPSVGGPIAMGYIGPKHAEPGTAINLMVRGKPQPAKISELPFAQHQYKKGAK